MTHTLNGTRPVATLLRPVPHAEPPAPRRSLDPYAEIEKRPLIVPTDGMRSKGFSVRIEDKGQASGWREVGIVSEDYLLVTNREVRDMAEEIAIRSGHDFTVTRTLFDGKRFTIALAFPFAHPVEVRVGDPVSIGILLENSYDASRKLSASLYVHRLACSNGMIAPQLFGRVRFKHTQASKAWEEEVQRVLSVIEHAPAGLQEFAQSAQRLVSARLSATHLKAIRKGPLATLPMTIWGRMLDQALLREEHSLYGLLNAGTAVLWHDPKLSVRDIEHNGTVTRGLLDYARSLN